MLARSLIAICIVISFLASPAPGRASEVDPFAAVLNERMPGLLAKYGVPGAVVAYIKDGDVAWTQAYGLGDLATGAPMEPNMVFNHGSDGKVLTAWGVMRLVELGLVHLDEPANRYLKRWQVQSSQFNPEEVTLRRLLSHTAGLTLRGLSDYGPRRTRPDLVEVMNGRNQLDGPVAIGWQPGTRFGYSSGGFAVLQMVIEDVTGEPFADFMEREITGPLGMSSLHWEWTPELISRAPTPYGLQEEPLEYRQLASQAVGSEVSTVPDFARFVAAAVEGPDGEPAGRGVLHPETVRQMLEVQPNTHGTEGLGYGLSGALLMHFGGNPGWTAHFVLDTARREGFVIANNSANGDPLNLAVHYLWLDTVLGTGGGPEPAPAPASYGIVPLAARVIAGLLLLGLLIAGIRFAYEVWNGRRQRSTAGPTRRILPLLVWGTLTLLWWYWFYAPWHLPLPANFPDIWRLPQTDLVLGTLLAWCAYSLLAMFFPRRAAASHVRATENFQRPESLPAQPAP
jgi:CubicO group peptidase (beta-lactamase class C family)